MKIIDKVCGKMGLISSDDTGMENISEEKNERVLPGSELENNASESLHNVVNLHANSGKENVMSCKMKVVVIEPKSFDDAQQVANCLKEKRPVVINFENTDGESAKRIVDFISGTTYALGGEIKKVGRNVFLCAPSNVNVAYTQEEKTVSSEMPWLK